MSSRTRLIVMSISAPVIAFAIVGGFLGKVMAGQDAPYQHLKIFDDVVTMISSQYVEEVNIDKVMNGAMHGLADGLDRDPAGFTLDHSSVVNRAPGKPIPQVVYDKLKAGGVIVDELGPDTLLAELRKVWREDAPHVAVATLLDWFASYVYLSRLRDDATLVISIEKLLGKIESPVGFAKSFNEADGKYEGVTQWSATLGTAIHGRHLRGHGNAGEDGFRG
jgi:hypothetical protein